MLRTADIEELVAKAGFDLCGVTRAEYLPQVEERFDSWLAEGNGGELDYLSRYKELRFDASKLIEGGQTVVVCGVNYKSEDSLASQHGVASYALMRDYHKTIRKRLKGILRELQTIYPQLEGRVFTDSAPLAEKSLAVKAGLGWIGRQSLVVTPRYGSFVLLGEILLNDEVDKYCEEEVRDGCGECRRCVDACPVGAINSNRTIDTRRCIASRTIEMDDVGELPLDGWIFGCEVCQRCCPHNLRSPLAIAEDMRPIITPPARSEWAEMSSEEFSRFVQGTPLKRSSIVRIRKILNRE